MTRIVISGGAESVVHMQTTPDGVELEINGVTIEVANPLNGRPRPAKALPHAAAPLLAIEGPKHGKRIGRPPLKRVITKRHHVHQPEEDQKIIDALLEFGPIPAEDLLNRMGISLKDRRRKILVQRLNRMRSRGTLKKHPQDQHKRVGFRMIVPRTKSSAGHGEGG